MVLGLILLVYNFKEGSFRDILFVLFIKKREKKENKL